MKNYRLIYSLLSEIIHPFQAIRSRPKWSIFEANVAIISQSESGYLSNDLRLVHRRVILFLKSTSERGGSDIEQLWISMTSYPIDFETTKLSFKIKSRTMSDPTLSDNDFSNGLGQTLDCP